MLSSTKNYLYTPLPQGPVNTPPDSSIISDTSVGSTAANLSSLRESNVESTSNSPLLITVTGGEETLNDAASMKSFNSNEISTANPINNPSPISSKKTRVQKNNNSTLSKLPSRLISFGSFCVAISDTSEMLMSLYDEGRVPLSVLIITGSITFFSSIGLNGKPTKESFEETLHILKNKSLPQFWSDSDEKKELLAEWPQLSPKKNYLSGTIAVPFILWGLFTDGGRTFFFVSNIRSEYAFVKIFPPAVWSTISGIITSGSVLTSLFTESTETLKMIRKILLGEMRDYASKLKRNVSFAVGGGLATIESILDMIKTYVAVRTVLGLTGHSIPLALGSLLSGTSNFFFSGIFAINSIYDFLCGKLSSAALFASFVLCGYLAWNDRFLNEQLYKDIVYDFDDNFYKQNPYLVETSAYALSWIMFTQETILWTFSLYRPMDWLEKKIINYYNATKKASTSAIITPDAPISSSHHAINAINAPINDPKEFDQYLKDNPYVMFNQKQKMEVNKKPAKTKQLFCGIM